jgi:endonuclease YncB( thermonuclease family)
LLGTSYDFLTLAKSLLFHVSMKKKIHTDEAGSSINYFIHHKFFIFIIPVLILFFLLSNPRAEIHQVKRVIDGDTLLLINGERVRLIGVDTPETKHPQKPVQYFGREAYLFTKEMVDGKEARFEFEGQKRDRYGRLLAYVYLLDGTFLNAEIIKQGYGFAYTRFPFRHMEEFRKYEREARENRKGLWR